MLYRVHLCMKCSLGISNFLEEIACLSHPVVFLYFFALIAEEGFLFSPCNSLELHILFGMSFPFSSVFALLHSSAICNASSDNHVASLYFFFFGMALVTACYTMLQISIHSSLDILSPKSNPLNPLITAV